MREKGHRVLVLQSNTVSKGWKSLSWVSANMLGLTYDVTELWLFTLNTLFSFRLRTSPNLQFFKSCSMNIHRKQKCLSFGAKKKEGLAFSYRGDIISVKCVFCNKKFSYLKGYSSISGICLRTKSINVVDKCVTIFQKLGKIIYHEQF